MKAIVLTVLGLVLNHCLLISASANEGKSRPENMRVLRMFDQDGDGKLNATELAKARDNYVNRAGPRDVNNLSPAVETKLRERFDANKDGKLDPNEVAKAREAFKEHRVQRGKGRDSRAKKAEAGH